MKVGLILFIPVSIRISELSFGAYKCCLGYNLAVDKNILKAPK